MFLKLFLADFFFIQGCYGVLWFCSAFFHHFFYFRFFTYCLKNEQECRLEFLNLIIQDYEFFERLQHIRYRCTYSSPYI